MKQMKFLLVALMAVVMSVSVTSCMNGENNPIYTGLAVAECVGTYPATFAVSNNQKLVVKDATLLDLKYGTTYMFYYQFNTEEQSASAASITVTLYQGSAPVAIDADYDDEGPKSNSPDYEADAALYSLGTSLFPSSFLLYNKKLLVPFGYWVKVEENTDKQKEELNKHSFVLTYDVTNIASGAKTLELTLNHKISDAEGEKVTRDRWAEGYKVYDLTAAITAFSEKSGTVPTTIKIKTKLNTSTGGSLEGAIDGTNEVTYTTE